MNREAFIQRYGGIYEHSPWVAERAVARLGEDASTEEIAAAMAACVDEASEEERLELIRAHPELAAKRAEPLTRSSADEQASAGLDSLSNEDFETFECLNADYRARFGFPFVIAVRGRSAAEILDVFRARVGHLPDVEFDTAIAEIHKIARLRLDALEADA